MEDVTQLPAEPDAPEKPEADEPSNPWLAHGFTVTEEHAQLLAHMIVGFVDKPEPGAPAIDLDEPYGSKDVYGDMRRILSRPGATDAEMQALQAQTATALQILLNTQRVAAGEYITPHGCCEWRPAAAI
jgi:hypothetical protein